MTESIIVSSSEKRIEYIETKEEQRFTADLYIDCTHQGQLIRTIQKPIQVNEQEIPTFKESHSNGVNSKGSSCSEIKIGAKGISTTSSTPKSSHTAIYDFSEKGEECYYFRNLWTGNCIAAGTAYCNIPELLICKDRLLETQIETLSKLLSTTKTSSYAQRYLEMISERLFNEMVDSTNLLLTKTSLNISLTERNAARRALFISSAATHKEDHSMIDENCWGGLLRGIGITPRATNAIASTANKEAILKKVMEQVSRRGAL